MNESLLQDVRYGLRQLRRSPLFTTAAVMTLGLAIGANSALFAIANAVLFRPLPYADPDRIVSITVAQKGTDIERMDEPTARLALTTGLPAFESFAMYETAGANLTGGSQPERVSGSRVSNRFFSVMTIQPALGRTFLVDDTPPGGVPVVILSDSLWTRAFGRSPDVIDRTIRLDDQSYTVIGVMPTGFRYPYRSEFWLPLMPRTLGTGFYYTDFIGRLRPTSSLDSARHELLSLRQSHEGELPKGVRALDIRMMPLHERLYGSYRGSLVLLLGIVACVLLIACANVANLLLARASARRRELALRAAIGASRGRLMRQLFIESVLLALLGAVPGLALAEAGVRAFKAFGPAGLTRIAGIAVDTQVLMFTLAVTIATGLLFGVAPAVAAGRADPHEWLKGARSTGVGSARSHPRRALVVLELAAAVVLTIGAALLAKSFVRFQAVDPGFHGDSVLTASVTLPRVRYADQASRRAFFDSVLERLRGLPAVESASKSPVALSGMTLTMTWPPRGAKDPASGDSPPIAMLTNVGSHHFRTFGIPLLAGTECAPEAETPLAVINDRMARRAFPERSAVGERLDLAGQGTYTVVGVASDVRRIGTNAMPLATVYTCATRTDAPFSAVIAVRGRGKTDPLTLAPALREAVRAADPAQPLSNVMTVSQIVGEAVTSRWFDAALVAAFAGIALILAIFGLYAVIAYLVAQRTHEIGVRMALGANRRDVIRLVLRQGGLLTAAGLALGLCAAVPLVRLLRSMLFEVEALDPSAFVATAAIMAVIAMTAAVIPALRAARVDPLIALRAE